MANIDTALTRSEEDRPHRRRSVIVGPDWRFSPPGSRWGAFAISFQQLRAVAKKSPTVAAIVQLRSQQLQAFARRPRHKGDRGFEIVNRQRPGNPTAQDQRVAEEVAQFFLETGWRADWLRPDMARWIAALTRDRYILDAASTELVYNRLGTLQEFWPVDGGTIEIQWSDRYIPTTRYGQQLDQPVAYVQTVDGQVETEYAADELCYWVANPMTDVTQGGYGLSELEACIDIVAAEILAIQYNSNYFDHGSVPPGILAIIGNFSEETLQELNVLWETDVKGVVGQHKPVALAMDDGKSVQWIPMKQSNREMELGDFLDKVRTGICSVFSVDPIEIGQRMASNSGGISQSENTEAKIDLSRDRGLLPAVDWLERNINRSLMPHLAPGYEFRFVGINAEDEDRKVAYLNQQVQIGGLTLREWRKAMGLAEVPPGSDDGPWLDAPLNPGALQVWMQARGMPGAPDLTQMSEAQRGALAQGPKDPAPEEVAKAWRWQWTHTR